MSTSIDFIYDVRTTNEILKDVDEQRPELTKEERDAAVGAIETADSYDLFVDLVINRLGYYPKKRTQLIDEKDWAEEN